MQELGFKAAFRHVVLLLKEMNVLALSTLLRFWYFRPYVATIKTAGTSSPLDDLSREDYFLVACAKIS